MRYRAIEVVEHQPVLEAVGRSATRLAHGNEPVGRRRGAVQGRGGVVAWCRIDRKGKGRLWLVAAGRREDGSPGSRGWGEVGVRGGRASPRAGTLPASPGRPWVTNWVTTAKFFGGRMRTSVHVAGGDPLHLPS